MRNLFIISTKFSFRGLFAIYNTFSRTINFICSMLYVEKRKTVATSRNFSACFHLSLCESPLKSTCCLCTYVQEYSDISTPCRFTTSLMSKVGCLLKWLSITINDRGTMKVFVVTIYPNNISLMLTIYRTMKQ